MAHMVFCTKYKAEMEGLDEPPFDTDFGQKIYKNVSKKAWGEWVERQKMLLNDYRLTALDAGSTSLLGRTDERVLLRRGRGAAQGIRRAYAVNA